MLRELTSANKETNNAPAESEVSVDIKYRVHVSILIIMSM